MKTILPRTIFDRYHFIAACRGYLPIGIGPHSTPRALCDAADQVEWLNLDVARELRQLAMDKRNSLAVARRLVS